MKKDFKIEMLPPIPEQQEKSIDSPQKSKINVANQVRLCVDVSKGLAEKIKDHVYWSRESQQGILLRILEDFIKANPVESRPEEKKTKKRGPKRKKIV